LALTYTPPLYETSLAHLVCPSIKAKTGLYVAQRQEPWACAIFHEVKPGVNDESVPTVMFIGTDTQHIIHRSLSCPIDHKDQKMRATLICGKEKVENILYSCHNDVNIKDSEQPSTANDAKTLPTTLITPEDLIGPSNLLDTQQCRTRTVKLTDTSLSELKDKKTRTKFLPSTIEDEVKRSRYWNICPKMCTMVLSGNIHVSTQIKA
jgi:hypothetical protein